MSLFKDERVPILVATNLAARGLDVKDIRYVINYDFPTQMEEYVHRVGRTGRAGALGTSFTFFTEDDARFAKELIKILSENGQRVPEELFSFINDRSKFVNKSRVIIMNFKGFKEKMMKHSQSAGNLDTKDFAYYENATPVYRESSFKPSSYKTTESVNTKSEGGMIRRSNIPSRNVGFFNSQLNLENAPKPDSTEILKQMDNFPTLAQTNTTKTSDSSTTKTEPEAKTSYQPSKGATQYESKQSNQNRGGQHESYKGQSNGSEKNAAPLGGITRSNFKRLNGPSVTESKSTQEESKNP